MTRFLRSAFAPAPDSLRPQGLLASKRHTLVFFGILTVLTVIGGLNRRTQPNASQSIEIDLFLIVAECLWVRFVYVGMQKYGHGLGEFLRPRPIELPQLVADLVLAAALVAFIHVATSAWDRLLPLPEQGNPLMVALPLGWVAQVLWVCLSLAAGIGEELVFRGYLQRQLSALTGRVGLAIVLQAVVFGLGHVYEGQAAVMRIVLIGLIFGIVAAWRGNIRACIVAHVTIDVLAGFGLNIA
jgi:membrane protease YdiL (CAAX protease family)